MGIDTGNAVGELIGLGDTGYAGTCVEQPLNGGRVGFLWRLLGQPSRHPSPYGAADNGEQILDGHAQAVEMSGVRCSRRDRPAITPHHKVGRGAPRATLRV
jgi:hypothetical protein